MTNQSSQGLSKKSQFLRDNRDYSFLFADDLEPSQPKGVKSCPSTSTASIKEGKRSIVVASVKQQSSPKKKESRKSSKVLSPLRSKPQAAGKRLVSDEYNDDEVYGPKDFLLFINKFIACDPAKYNYDIEEAFLAAYEEFKWEKHKRVNVGDEERHPKKKKKKKRSLDEIYQRCPQIQ